ncbi:MAG: ATP-binding protein [Spirochaetales bacterium]|nr:ATP-binding protein [Spirochaetales bacterium]
MSLLKRQIDQYIWSEELSGNKMIFLSGPRQIGKTYYAKEVLKKNPGGYYNWDNPDIRSQYIKNALFFLNDKKTSDFLVVMDEIHKRKKWKDILKGLYDTVEPACRFLITGSARLNLFRKSGDSLVGRYTHFNMLPVSLGELLGKKITDAWLLNESDWKDPWKNLLSRLTGQITLSTGDYEQLYHFGGFPEPLTRDSDRFLNKWKKEYISLILTEDLRELTRIHEIDTAERIMMFLFNRVGNPLSVKSLAEDAGTSSPTVVNHLAQMERLWLIWSLYPWNKRINRAVRKEKKAYFINWIYVENPGQRFENFIGVMLSRFCQILNDNGLGDAELRYIRNYDGNEADFLLILNKKPVLIIEAKLSDIKIPTPVRNFGISLGIPVIQVLHTSGVFRKVSENECVISADRFLEVLP